MHGKGKKEIILSRIEEVETKKTDDFKKEKKLVCA